MSQQIAMRALIGKDARIIFPLVVIGWIGCLVCNFLLFMLWQYWGVDKFGISRGSITIWALIPGLVAFGAASLLIGTEEDSGTLSWLRTLPVSWREVAASKLIVGLAAFASVFALASLILWLFSHGWRGVTSSSGYSHLSLQEASAVLFFQLLLLLLGFVVSYGIRMPVAGLVVLLPLFGFVSIVFGILIEWVLIFFGILMERVLLEERGVVSPVAALVFGSGFLLIIGLLQHLLARRRLTRADSSKWVLASDSPANASRYRPPSLGMYSKPSQAASLLWQQCRQTAPACLFMIGASLLAMLLLMTSLDQPAREGRVLIVIIGLLTPLLIILSASWIGVMTFYADNRHRRYAFLTDRGISPTKIWWTRLAPTLIGVIVLAISLMTLGRWFDHDTLGEFSDGWQIFPLLFVMFAFGQLVSQGIERPVLAFAAAPAYASICLMPMFYLLEEAALLWMLATVPILLLASWHLSKWWLEGRNQTGYTLRVIGYSILAVGLPCLLYAGSMFLALAHRHL